MGNLASRTPKPLLREAQSTPDSYGRLQGSEIYNRSSLAFDFGGAGVGSLEWQSQVTSELTPAIHAVPDTLIFKELDRLQFKRDRTSSVISFLLHVLAATGVLWWGLTAHIHVVQTQTATVVPVEFKVYDPPPPPPPVMPIAKVMGGGGGGGAHQVVEPIKGHPPTKVATIQTLPPQIARINSPKLEVEPTVQVKMPSNDKMPNLGMSQSPQIALASQGSGAGSGFGHGIGGGIGMGKGSGAGPGSGGGYGGGIMSVGGGVGAPVVIHSVEPEFTEEARRANFQGTVSIQLIVDSQGNPQNVRVMRHLGMGLDDKAIEAVRQYKFNPAMYQGHPVAVQMVVEVDFHLH